MGRRIIFNKEHLEIKIMVLIIILSLAIKCAFFTMVSWDMENYLLKWTNHYSNLSLVEFLKDTTSDYPIFYNYFLFIVSKIFPSNGYIYVIKLFSMFFDISSGFGIYMIAKTKLDKKNSVILFGISLLLPTIIWNSGVWGQCDSIYVSFLIWTIYFILIDKPYISLLMFSFSFLNKIQAIFLVPFLFLCLLKKKYKIYQFLIIPAVYFIFISPALIAGHPFKHLILPYTSFPYVCNNCPNLYSFFMLSDTLNTSKVLTYILIGFAFILCLLYVIYFYKKDLKMNTTNIVLLATISIFICVYTLPKMHERYFYAIDLLSVVLFMLYKNRYSLICAIFANFASIMSYMYMIDKYCVVVGSIFMLTALILGIINVRKYLKEKNYEENINSNTVL